MYFNPINSINNLYQTCDPRDQLVQDINQVKNTYQMPFQNNSIQIGMSPMDKLLKQRQNQIDPKNQEWQDIQMHLNDPFKFNK